MKEAWQCKQKRSWRGDLELVILELDSVRALSGVFKTKGFWMILSDAAMLWLISFLSICIDIGKVAQARAGALIHCANSMKICA